MLRNNDQEEEKSALTKWNDQLAMLLEDEGEDGEEGESIVLEVPTDFIDEQTDTYIRRTIIYLLTGWSILMLIGTMYSFTNLKGIMRYIKYCDKGS